MIVRTWQAIALTIAALVFPASVANADGMSCGYDMVVSGDSLYKVRSVCGNPAAATQRIEQRLVDHRICRPFKGKVRCSSYPEWITVVVDQWTYDFGRYRFIQILTFEQGILMKVETGGRGRK
jgi:hypothetical protein